MLDAYTVKKVLPRILVAAILINLSYYLVAIAIDVSNILGQSVGDLLTKSFGMGSIGHAKFQSADLSTGDKASLVVIDGAIVGVGIFALVPSISKVVGGLAQPGGIMSMFQGLLFAVLVPALLIVLAVIATLCIRIGMIYLLVVLAPIAFACYCLPNTEQYFKRWWKLLQETLLIYPIITIMFALSLIMSQSTSWATNSADGASGGILVAVGYLVSLIMLILPLIGIPFAFKIAGGVLGRVHDFANNAGQKGIQNGLLKSRREAAVHKAGLTMGQGQASIWRKLNKGGATSRWAARRVASYQDIRSLESARNAEELKRAQADNDTGDDTTRRALSVDKKWADNHGVEGTDWKTVDGKRQYRTAGGAWVRGADVDEAYRLYGGNQAAMQWSLGHEMEKANGKDQNDYLQSSMGRLLGADSSWGLDEDQAKGTLQGAAFSKQNIDRQWKHYDLNHKDGKLEMGTSQALSIHREMAGKQGNYAGMQLNAGTWDTMSSTMEDSYNLLYETPGVLADGTTATAQQMDDAREVLNQAQLTAHANRSASMATTPVSSSGTAATTGTPPAGMVGGGRDIGAGAAPLTQEAMNLYNQTAERIAENVRGHVASGTTAETAGLQYSSPRVASPSVTLPPGVSANPTINERRTARPGGPGVNSGATGNAGEAPGGGSPKRRDGF